MLAVMTVIEVEVLDKAEETQGSENLHTLFSSFSVKNRELKPSHLSLKDRPIRRCVFASTIHEDTFKETFNVEPVPV